MSDRAAVAAGLFQDIALELGRDLALCDSRGPVWPVRVRLGQQAVRAQLADDRLSQRDEVWCVEFALLAEVTNEDGQMPLRLDAGWLGFFCAGPSEIDVPAQPPHPPARRKGRTPALPLLQEEVLEPRFVKAALGEVGERRAR